MLHFELSRHVWNKFVTNPKNFTQDPTSRLDQMLGTPMGLAVCGNLFKCVSFISISSSQHGNRHNIILAGSHKIKFCQVFLIVVGLQSLFEDTQMTQMITSRRSSFHHLDSSCWFPSCPERWWDDALWQEEAGPFLAVQARISVLNMMWVATGSQWRSAAMGGVGELGKAEISLVH